MPPPALGGYFTSIQQEYDRALTRSGAVPPLVPKLPTSLVLAERTSVFPTRMMIGSITADGSSICFERLAVEDRSKDAESVAQDELRIANTSEGFAYRAVGSLAAEKDRPVWPAPADASRVTSVKVLESKIEDFKHPNEATVKKLVVTYELCGPLPAGAKDAKFLVVTQRFPMEAEGLEPSKYEPQEGEVEVPPTPDQIRAAYGVMLIAITDDQIDLTK